MDDLTEVIASLVARRLKDGAAPAGIDPDAPLSGLGLDSIAVVSLMVELERRRGVTLPAELVNRATFRSVRTLTEAVRRAESAAGRLP
ncbi:phosphopantetheine-binding protein [Actinocorallia sp. API 0066]|uniref:acyl carrier protein n=1 Tax=Actinocorallia sp. API 0066 TaxID=2896846 RepID=UPI001E3DD758|nr:acyl carrier protein [Actinocorallia sp. API 0066]MCD0451616.1 phosphopantetheine-binding protein [Actinocorallia sp. API 0066]